MTSLSETVRHNLATEGIEQEKVKISWQTLAENIRHNIAEEGLKYDTLRETVRNNKVMNRYYLGSLEETETHNRNVELKDLEQLAEAIRHNLAVEKETWRNHTATENEISMHNQAEEWLKQLDIAVNAWKAQGGKVGSSTGGGGKSGQIIGDIVADPFVELLKGVAPGLLNSITGGTAYAVSSQQKFNIRDKFTPSAAESSEPTYQKVIVTVDKSAVDRDANRNEIPVDISSSKGPSSSNYSNSPIVDVSNYGETKSSSPSSTYVTDYKGSHYSNMVEATKKNPPKRDNIRNYNGKSQASPSGGGSRSGGSSGGGTRTSSNTIYSPSANKDNYGPGVSKPTDSAAQGTGGPSSPTGGGGYAGGGYGGGTR